MRRREKSADRGWLFITGATYRRIPLFREREHCEIFLENLRFYRKKYRFDVSGYALLPDHYHLLLRMPEEVALPGLLRDFKSAVGRQVIDALKRNNQDRLLERLLVPRLPRRRKDARFRVLQADNYVKRVFSAGIAQVLGDECLQPQTFIQLAHQNEASVRSDARSLERDFQEAVERELEWLVL